MALHNNTNLNIIYWNCQSLYHKATEVFDHIVKENVDVALLSETWLKPKHNLSLQNYSIYRADRIENEHGGVAIIIRNSI